MNNIKFLCITLLSVLFLIVSNIAVAEPLSATLTKYAAVNNKTPTKVWVDTYLFDIDDFNLMKGSYEMNFYMGFRCVPNCDHLNVELINGKEEAREVYESYPDYRYYRITALLSQNMDFHRYPFERHNLHIVLEDKFLDQDKLIFLPDVKHSGINREINLLGWSEEPTWSAKAVNFDYPNYNQIHSRYTFTMQIARPILAGVLKNIVPGVFIMLVGFLTIFLDTNKAINGLAIVSGALISMILLHLANISSIPENDYMTYLDSFMLINYLGLFLLLAELIALINSSGFTPVHHVIFKKIRYITPLLWLLLQLINCLVFFT